MINTLFLPLLEVKNYIKLINKSQITHKYLISETQIGVIDSEYYFDFYNMSTTKTTRYYVFNAIPMIQEKITERIFVIEMNLYDYILMDMGSKIVLQNKLPLISKSAMIKFNKNIEQYNLYIDFLDNFLPENTFKTIKTEFDINEPTKITVIATNINDGVVIQPIIFNINIDEKNIDSLVALAKIKFDTFIKEKIIEEKKLRNIE